MGKYHETVFISISYPIYSPLKFGALALSLSKVSTYDCVRGMNEGFCVK